MSRYLVNLTNGQMDEKGIFWMMGDLLTQSGVLQSGALAVSAQSTPDMTVKAAGATTGHSIVFITSAGDTYYGRNTANENVTITANASGVTKTDAIVAYADLAAGISTSNNPDALKFVAVRRGGSDTGNPTSGEISSAVSSNPYVVLAYVTVANGSSSVNSGNITDARTRAYFDADRLEPIGTSQLSDDAVTPAKLQDSGAFTVASLNATTSDITTQTVASLYGDFAAESGSGATTTFTKIIEMTGNSMYMVMASMTGSNTEISCVFLVANLGLNLRNIFVTLINADYSNGTIGIGTRDGGAQGTFATNQGNGVVLTYTTSVSVSWNYKVIRLNAL